MNAPAPGKVTIQTDGAIARITLDNPAKRNALSLQMWKQLDTLLTAAEENSGLRVVIVRGAGTEAFASGADIAEFVDKRRTAADVQEYEAVSRAALARLRTLTHPTIASIHGYCIGGGLAIAASCDLRIASEQAIFAIPAGRVGLGYAWTELKTLLDIVGAAFTKELLFTARRVPAGEAQARALINECVPAAELDTRVETLAQTIAANAPLTLRAAKRMSAELLRSPGNMDIELCEQLARACYESDDYLEGISAFLQKRTPGFHGR